MHTALECIPCFARQGNFEALSDEPSNIFFLFKVKCRVIAGHVSLPLGTHVLTPTAEAQPVTGGADHART